MNAGSTCVAPAGSNAVEHCRNTRRTERWKLK